MSQVEELKALSDDLKSGWEEYKTQLETRWEAEAAKYGEQTGETVAMFERLDARLDETVDEMNVRLQKLADTGSSGRQDGPSPARVAYEKILRQGIGKASDEERALLRYTDGEGNDLQASMVISDDSDGGWLAPDDVVDTIITGVVEYSPIREIAFVRSTSRNSVKAPKRTQTTSAVWAGEQDTRSETQNLKFGKEELSTKELSAMADISRQDLEDAAVDLEQLVYSDFAEQFGVAEGTAFVSGDGVDGKPEGFLSAADTGYLGAQGVYTRTSSTNDALVADDLITVFYDLKDVYAKRATWVWLRATTALIRKMRADDDNFLWQPGLATLAPPTVLGQPYVEAIDMPAVGNGALAVAFGDWKKAYWIVDRIQIETLRDPYTQAGTGFVRFWARKRVGGQVVLPEALKFIEIQ